jgi:hypothetical protein
MHRRAIILGLWLGTTGLWAAAADPPAVRFAGDIARYKESAASAHDALTALMTELKQFPVFVKTDGPLFTAWSEEVARTWTEAAAALEKGDESAANALVRRAGHLAGQRDRWQERLRWRAQQAQQGEYLPASAEVFAILAADRKAEDLKECEAFLEAKKRRSEAHGRLAEATVPGADSKTLFKLQDGVFAADVEVGVAEMKYNWSRADWEYRTWVGRDPTITSPELTAAKERLAEWRRQREEIYRQSRSRQHALEQLDRDGNGLLTARDSAYRTAKAAQEAPKKDK